MKTEIETHAGTCSTHGRVEATREIPRPSFPFVVYAVRRWRARREPYRCPTCSAPVSEERVS
jgi:hypothetical protein